MPKLSVSKFVFVFNIYVVVFTRRNVYKTAQRWVVTLNFNKFQQWIDFVNNEKLLTSFEAFYRPKNRTNDFAS